MKEARNAPCPCGSGRKYKQCCALKAVQPAAGPSAGAQQNLVDLFRAERFAELEKQALALAKRWPGHGPSWNFVGVAQLAQRKDAFEALERAATLLPNDPTAQNNFGNALKEKKRLEEAAERFARAVTLRPDHARAHLNLGAVLKDMGRLEDSIVHSRHALALNPDYPEAMCNLGIALTFLGRPLEAAPVLRQAVARKAKFVEARIGLGMALCGLGDLQGAEDELRRALEIEPDSMFARTILIFVLNYQPGKPRALLLEEARRFGAVVARQARPFEQWTNVPDPTRRLRVGFVSGDFCQHPVAQFLEHVLETLKSDQGDRLELVAYHARPYSDAFTERLRSHFSEWRDVAEHEDEALAEQIRADAIDILIDLSGHTSHNRLAMFAWKPAPVQMTWLGYLATTGVPAIDYLLADPLVLPEALEDAFTERVVRMPKSYLCFTPPEHDAPVAALPALTEGGVTFGSFNNFNKLNEVVLDLWARILREVPDSRLLIKTRQLVDPKMQERVAGFFAERGVAADRLRLFGHVSREAHLAMYGQVDIALDPFPYPGITTTVEALWMGVPVLSLAGDSFMGRQGVGLLTHVGLEDWIAADAEDYLRRAVAHAADLRALGRVRSELRARLQASPVFDRKGFAADFEAVLRQIWTTWCHGGTTPA